MKLLHGVRETSKLAWCRTAWEGSGQRRKVSAIVIPEQATWCCTHLIPSLFLLASPFFPASHTWPITPDLPHLAAHTWPPIPALLCLASHGWPPTPGFSHLTSYTWLPIPGLSCLASHTWPPTPGPPHLASWPHQQPALPGGRQSQMTGPTPERPPGFLLPCNQNQMHLSAFHQRKPKAL